MPNREILTALSPCTDGLARAAECPTLREWWETSTSRSDMIWLIGKAHSRGTLSRRRLVYVAVRCAETVAHLMPPAALPLLADVSAWAHGADDVDLVATRASLWEIRCAAHAAATAATYDAATAATAAYDAADAATAAYDAADALAYAAAYASAALCDVIRDAIAIDEMCAALGLDPDQGVM